MESFSNNSLESKTPEYDFETGVKESIKRIIGLLKDLKRDVYVVINGSNINVGKTKLLSSLQQKLAVMGIPTEHMLDVSARAEGFKVVILTTSGLFNKKGENYGEELLKNIPDAAGKVNSYGDLYIGIYRPDKPFLEHSSGRMQPVADIMIRNDKAVDK